jgi:hypothetical protein
MSDIIVKYAFLKQREGQSIEDDANQKIAQEDENQTKVRDLNRVIAHLDAYTSDNKFTLQEYEALDAELQGVCGKTLDQLGMSLLIHDAFATADQAAYLTNDDPNSPNNDPQTMKKSLETVEKNISAMRDDVKGNESRMNLEMQMAVSDLQTAQQATAGLEKKEEDHRAALQRFIFG